VNTPCMVRSRVGSVIKRIFGLTPGEFRSHWPEDHLALGMGSEAWNAMQSDTRTLFAQPIGLVIASERVQTDTDAGVGS